MYRAALQTAKRPAIGLQSTALSAGAARLHTRARVCRQAEQRQHEQHGQHEQHHKGPQIDSLDGEIEGVEPEVSPYAVGASVFFLGGLSYYLYSEYGQSIQRHLPWSSSSSVSGDLVEAEKESRNEARRQRRMRAKMAPVSTMSALEQVNWAWTHPGLYVVGSNEYGLVDPLHPGSGVGFKAAVPGLEGKVIRDAAFAKTHAAAVDVDGNLYQWGTGFAGKNTPHRPTCTLKDAGIHALAASDNYIAALDKKSRVRVIRGNSNPSSSESHEQAATERVLEFEPKLGWRENVVAISAGKDHLAATTNYGNVYTCALGPDGNSRHQLGHGPQAQPDSALFKLKRVMANRTFSAAACGSEHTLLLTTDGDVYGCGANDFGQLAQGDFTEANSTVSQITPLRKLWKDGLFRPEAARAVQIAAGGTTSYVEVKQDDNIQLLSCGCGINGQLGNGTMAHMQGKFTKIAALSNHQEFDAESGTRRPVGIRSISAANEHVVAVRENKTNVVLDKSGDSVGKVPLYGYDVLVWGSNSSGQCIPDRRHRFVEPDHPPPLYTTRGSAQGARSARDTSGYSNVMAPRLQAAPSQWVSALSFRTTGADRPAGKALVEQAFVAGHSVTAAFLRPSAK
ncbi:RCC1/BLIP-II [Martensiomyces pterosporus]|nr:RCC1/BLIP-II [Martensiomyces pterosporus]